MPNKIPNVQLKRARQAQGWTQGELAEKVETDDKIVSRWETGLRKTSLFYQRKLCALFQKTPEELGFLTEEAEEISQPALHQTHHEREKPYPPIWDIPISVPIPFFVGRKDILQRLQDAFLTEKTTTLTHAISGLGGIGKTLTAVQYAHEYRDRYDAILWIDASTHESVHIGLAKMASTLKLPIKNPKEYDQILVAIKQWMKEHTRWLLILDNADDITLIKDVLSPIRRGHILITTRTQATGNYMINIELDNLTTEEGALLLLRKAELLLIDESLDEVSDSNHTNALHLSRLMSGLPLALDQAGAYIKEVGCNLSEYIQLYEKRQMDMLRWRSSAHPDEGYDKYPHSVATTWSLSFDKVQQSSKAAADLLHFYAFLSPDAIPESIVIRGASELGPYLQEVIDKFAFNAIIAELRRYSLVRRYGREGIDHTETIVSIHRLIQTVFKDRMDEETKELWAERTVRAIYKTLTEVKEAPLQEQDTYYPHAQQCYDWIITWSFRFSEAEVLLILLGNYASKRMLYSQAKEYLLQAIAITEAMHSPTHVQRAVVYNHIASLYGEMGEYNNADTFFRKAVLIFEKNSSPEMNILLAYTLSNLAANQEKLNNLVEAEQYARRAVETMKQTKGASNHDIGYTLNTHEIILYRLNRQGDAEQVAHQNNAISHPERESDLVRAKMLENQGEKQHPIQIDLIEQALVLYQRVYGQEHTDIAHCLSSIGTGYMERKDYILAKSYYQQAMDMYIHMNFTEHNDFVMILTQMGLSCLFLNEMKEASTFFDRAREAAQKNPSPYVTTQMLDTFSSTAKSNEKS